MDTQKKAGDKRQSKTTSGAGKKTTPTKRGVKKGSQIREKESSWNSQRTSAIDHSVSGHIKGDPAPVYVVPGMQIQRENYTKAYISYVKSTLESEKVLNDFSNSLLRDLIRTHNKKYQPIFHTDPRDDNSVLTLIDISREGLKYSSFKKMMDKIQLPNENWAKVMDIQPRTFSHLKTSKKDLNKYQTEIVMQLAILFDKGVELFGEEDKFKKWIKRPRLSLGNKRPLDLFDTIQGIKMVENLLQRIEAGVSL